METALARSLPVKEMEKSRMETGGECEAGHFYVDANGRSQQQGESRGSQKKFPVIKGARPQRKCEGWVRGATRVWQGRDLGQRRAGLDRAARLAWEAPVLQPRTWWERPAVGA